MSMIGNFGLLPGAELDRVLAEPDTIHDLIHPDDVDLFADETRFLCVEKSWHAIHFLINRQPWTGEAPLDFIVAGGTDVGDVDVGYGPARVYAPAELRALVAALDALTDDGLRANFTAEALASSERLYPGYGPEDVDHVLRGFHALRQFLASGPPRDLGLIVWCD